MPLETRLDEFQPDSRHDRNGVLQPGSGQCRDFHPMKGPMLTQTLVGLSGEQPFHWRGDRATLGHFAGTTSVLQGADAAFTAAEMQRLQACLATISFPPNPNRNLDGSLRASVAGGSPVTGQTLYMTGNLAGGQCVTCHALPNGGGSSVISANLLLTTQDMNIPHLRNMHEKDGFDSATSATNRRGFGFAHDGAHPTLIDFFRLPVFRFASGATGDQQRRDVSAFVLSFENGTHASVGAQATLGGSASTGTARRSQLVTIANAGSAQLIAKVVVSGVERGYLYQSATGSFLTDLSGQTETLAGLDALADAGMAVTYTLLPNGTGRRAIDRDGDGVLDGDERGAGTNPDDPSSYPGACPTGCENIFGDSFETAQAP